MFSYEDPNYFYHVISTTVTHSGKCKTMGEIKNTCAFCDLG